MRHSFLELRTIGCGVLVLALVGCSRSAVVLAPDGAAANEEPAAEKTIARGQADEAEGTSFAFPDDDGGVLLAKLLPPRAPETISPVRSETPRRASSAALRLPPALPLPPSHAALPRLPDDTKRSPLRPHLVLDETLGLPDTPVLPDSSVMPAGERVRVPSIDVNEPIPLPILAKPVPDRAALDDPTQETSTAAAQAASMPARTHKAPFLKLTLPDPYERRRTELPTPKESTEFPLGTPRTPGR